MGDALRIGILGYGNIGSGVIDTLQRNRDALRARCPRPLELCRVADIDLERPRDLQVDPDILTDDSESVVRDPGIDVIVELIGGVDPARGLVETALREGKHVVTANKALLAAHGPELFALANEKGVRLLFEAAVGGGIPCVRALCESLAADRITRIQGILNGTCNYILTQMCEAAMSFGEALEKAQELGYAEPDPTADVEGIDAANKIAILASLAFGRDIRMEDVYREGITALTHRDLRAAERCGYVIKHTAVAERVKGGRVAVSVRPTLLWADNPLATIDGVLNGVVYEGALVGTVFLAGPGAGPSPTATAVLSDVMALSALEAGQPAPAPFLSVEVGKRAAITGECDCSGFWLRIRTRGAAHEVAAAARTLAEANIPVSGIWERPGPVDETSEARVIEVFTGRASHKTVHAASKEIEAADWGAPGGAVLVLPRID